MGPVDPDSRVPTPRAERLLDSILIDRGLTYAEYVILFHLSDSVATDREGLSAHASDPAIRQDTGVSAPHDDCLHAIDSLATRQLVVELTENEIAADLARWSDEKLPVSWGVERRRCVGDIDLTLAGFDEYAEIVRAEFASYVRRIAYGYNDESSDMVRVFGETPAACEENLGFILSRGMERPWPWPREATNIGPMVEIGPWWYSRFELIPTGFEVVLRRADSSRDSKETA